MKSYKAYITDYIKNPDIEKEILGDYLISEKDYSAEIILVWHEKIDKEFIDKHPNLKTILRYGVGFDNIDYKYARKKGIFVCNNPDYGVDEVADTSLSMVLNCIRKTNRYDALSKKLPLDWQENTIKTIKRTDQVVLGVLGAGRIGSSIILKANSLGIKTQFFDPYLVSGYEKVIKSKRCDNLKELLSSSDIISINVPLTEETKDLVDENFIKEMKKGSSLICTARGKIIKDLDIFLHYLKNNHLDMLCLDVLPQEPPNKSSLLIQEWIKNSEWIQGRVIINPHTAYYSKESFIEMREKIAKNALRIIKGEKPLNIIN